MEGLFSTRRLLSRATHRIRLKASRLGLSPANSGALALGASNGDYGGAGGGGYYGGGSGGSGFSGNHSGGGGGSSYLDTLSCTYVSGIDGFNSTTDGSVVVENVSP